VFTVPSKSRTTLKILNTAGQEIAILYDDVAEVGKNNQVQFNPNGLAKGVYFSELRFNDHVNVEKIALVK
jgi:hypothetical protein